MRLQIESQLFAAINTCEYLYLRELSEPRNNSLRLVIEEASASPETVSVKIHGVEIPDCRRIQSSGYSRLFELIWESYVAYNVTDESFKQPDPYEVIEVDGLVRIFSKSRFLDYIAVSTFAMQITQGPFGHTQVACQHHISRRVEQLRPPASKPLRLT